jgi:DNA-binding transcriptional MerR regulator
MGSLDMAQMVVQTGLTAHTLRYYEKEQLIQEVPRDVGGRRRYGEAHLRVIRFVNALRATGMPIKEIKRYLALYQEGDGTHDDRLALLENHREHVRQKLRQIKHNLQVIDVKIASYGRPTKQ